MTRSIRGRRVAAGLLALVVALGLTVAAPAAPEARAARPDLTIVTDARYEVQPEERRVRITVGLVATNHLRDTATRRYYFDRAYLAVLPGTTGFAISGGSGKPTVRVDRATPDYNVLLITFGQRIFSGRTASFTLTFDLPDPGGEPTRDVRVGTSLVSFPVWAFATDSTPGSTVSVAFPTGFTVQLEAGELPEPETDADGRLVYRSGKLSEPLTFFAYFVADRPGSYEETERQATVGEGTARLIVRGWPDDPDWAERVGGLFEQGLPVLGELIGLPWDRTEPLVVQETVSRTTGGYAGLFDPGAGRIEVAYYADTFVVLHEAAHAWFNGALLADRWANEAFASYYALEAAAALDEPIEADELTEELEAARIPLNAWGAIGREETAVEDYAYAATLELARSVAARAGPDGLRRVWAAAASGTFAYQPPGRGRPEDGAGPPDWRGLLDLLEEHGDATYDDLWRTWVVRDEEASLLDERRESRAEYRSVLTLAGDWRLPASIRAALRAWQFDQADRLLGEARDILARREQVDEAARSAGLEPPDTLRTAFEGDAGFAAMVAAAEAQMQAIRGLEAAAGSRIPQPDPVESLGLFGSNPDGALDDAREAFRSGDLARAMRSAMAAQAIWQSAADVGRDRLLAIVGSVTLLVLGAVALIQFWKRRRVGREAVPPEGV